MRTADGPYRWFECSGNNQIADPSIRGLVVSLRDSTDRREAETALRFSEQRNRSIVEAAADAIISVNTHGIIETFNRAAEHIFETRAVDAIGEYYRRFLPEDSLKVVRTAIEQGLTGAPIETIATRASGERFAAQVAVSDVRVGENHYYTAVVHDISDQRALEHALRVAAAYDELTGLPNRRTLLDRAHEAIEDARRTNDVVGMVFVDLDRFKLVNDGLGHDAGDQLLVLVAGRIAGAIRAEDVVARLGSDEFVVLCPSASDLGAIRAVAVRIADALAAPFVVSGREVFVGASMGLSVGTGEETPLELLRCADTAMYRAKEGRSQVEVFDARMERHASRRLDLESALRRAAGRGELRSYYQPIIELDEGHVAMVEALVRWHRPGYGLIAPEAFIAVAEEAGIINEIGAWMLGRATADCARWQEVAPGVGVTVNVSVCQFDSGDLVREVADALAHSGLPPDLLTVEITESVMLGHTERNAETMRRIRDLGVHISLDDFGTGYSSLTYLRMLPIDSIKIDRSFLQSLGSAGGDLAMLSAIVNLGTARHLTVVAEGVDTDTKLGAVRAAGCHAAQGYLFSKPLPFADAFDYLELRQRRVGRSCRERPKRCLEPASGAARRDEHRDDAFGLALVVRVVGVGGDGPVPPPRALVAFELADFDRERLGPVLDEHLVGMRFEVVVPDRMRGRAAHRRDERVLAVVLDAHQRDLADLAALVAAHRDDDDGQPTVEQRVRFFPAGPFVGRDLIADPLHRARLVLTGKCHGRHDTGTGDQRGPERLRGDARELGPRELDQALDRARFDAQHPCDLATRTLRVEERNHLLVGR